ncbi:MAG TPA: ABC transporter permease, partial [Spirochaetia bacterium]|nr:ABC transporter permease [Spirochaetia bacterium]
ACVSGGCPFRRHPWSHEWAADRETSDTPHRVTLGTMSIIYGVMFYVTGGNWVNSGIPQSFITFGRIDIGHFHTAAGERTGVPIQFLFFVAAAIVTWFLLRFTMFGRGIFALGGNRVSAERAGFNIPRITVLVYLFEGILIGIAGVVHTSIVRQVDPNAFNGFELQVIAAVVLGGTSILGGYGSLFGTVLGVSLIAVLNNGLTLMRISSFWQRIIIGLVIIVAVSVDIIRKKRAEARQTRVDIDTSEEVSA